MGNENKDHVIKVEMEERTVRKKKSVVKPGHQQVSNNDVVTWKNMDSQAVFFFPRKELFGKREYEVPKGGDLTLTVKGGAKPGRYPYAVYTDNNDFAEGGSFPELIVR